MTALQWRVNLKTGFSMKLLKMGYKLFLQRKRVTEMNQEETIERHEISPRQYECGPKR